MSIVDFIAVVSFGLTCFGLGYTFGKDNNKPQKWVFTFSSGMDFLHGE